MKRRLVTLLLLVAVFVSSMLRSAPSVASDYSGYVTSIVQIGTRTFIYIGDGCFGTDNCGSGRTSLILFAETATSEGKSFISMATAAKLTRNQVYVAGNGACYTGNTPNGGVSESMNVLWLQ